ncbi:MAG: SCP2 sterol-binding domain-containing protein [Gammaproteobacteria bacterium]|nr:SCP2 sterol-binding domain-containing protein [Gammaproteobacteria bacterium]MCP5409528.1 SCP2 sterol-binding domain-containing protein [Chromatiaceae bacterium]MCP5444800.1 SCP2 sterol-binding domain-containing protein [Chromatiaceae bacterium]
MSLSALAYAVLEAALNSYLDLDTGARKQMEKLYGKVIAFEILGLGRTVYLIPGPGKMQVLEIFEGAPDCCISGTPSALARMSNRDSNSDQLFSGEVEISGDSELAHQLSRILGSMNIDWEEQLSRFTGDLIAHRIGNLFRTAQEWGTNSVATLYLDVQEYLQEELHLLPGRLEIEHFVGGVDTLRDDVERLQVRISLLQKRQAEVQ